MQLESNFSLILNSSTFIDLTGIIPNLHYSKLHYLHSLPQSGSRVPTGPGLRNLYRSYISWSILSVPGKWMLA